MKSKLHVEPKLNGDVFGDESSIMTQKFSEAPKFMDNPPTIIEKQYPYTHVFVGSSKVYFLKLKSITKRGKAFFDVTEVQLLNKNKKKNLKTLTKWKTDKNLYTAKQFNESSKEIVKIGKTKFLKAFIDNLEDRTFIPKQVHFIYPKWIDSILIDIHRDKNVMLTGHGGTGKTHTPMQIASKLGIPCFRIQCSSGMQSESLLGGYVPSADGKARWADGLITQACRKGYWIILDEWDACPAHIRTILQGLLEPGHRTLTLSDKDGGEIISKENKTIHERFRIFATGNTLGAMSEFADLYGGMSDGNAAQLSRWSVYIVDPPTEAELFKIIKGRIPEIGRKTIRNIVDIFSAVNKLKLNGNMFNTRIALELGDKLKDGIDIKSALKPVFLNHIETSLQIKILNAIGLK